MQVQNSNLRHLAHEANELPTAPTCDMATYSHEPAAKKTIQ